MLPDSDFARMLMADGVEVSVVGDGGANFEALGKENGQRFWWKSDLAILLGYAPGNVFDKAVTRAMAACSALGIGIAGNFDHVNREVDGEVVADCKLSRFACYLTAMNADSHKPQVASAQAYFAGLAEVAAEYMAHTEGVDRVLIRDEVTDRSKSLAGAAKAAGVVNYGLFHDQGYRGLYNAGLKTIEKLKGIPKGKKLLDFMGKEELASNLFRMTQTEAKLKKDKIRGDIPAAQTAKIVGREVRDAIVKIGGTMPEDLPIAEEIQSVRRAFKQTAKQLQNMDKKNLQKPKKPKPPAAE